jgi:hypothetical protein
MDSDILRQEFGTENNSLSFWKCNDLSDITDAVKAILLSTSAIKVSQFVIIEQSVIERCGLTMDDSEAGVTGYMGFEDLHVNMTNLTCGKIGTVMDILHEITKDEMYTPKYEKDEVKAYIKEVIDEGRLNKQAINDFLLKDIIKFFPEQYEYAHTS